ncbi:hypothetical protein [Ilumatobacter sp.]|uniref:hypothetical protein n=1 Tax=Ilumatobacter sp. TaxID=1967498 RepID=UPI003AF7D87A
MIAILLDTTPYRIMSLLHILAAVVAFGPLFLYPGLRKAGETTTIASMHMRMAFPALILMWVLGMGLAGMSEDAYSVSQLWLSLSIVNWVVLVAVSWFLIRPAITDSSESAVARLAAGTGLTHLGLIVGLVLMIWKPGL